MGLEPPPWPRADDARRAELADFLRTRRAALKPDDPGPGRRRTPGLRREEVAQRSGVGLSWYTWLEQGRDVTPSDQVLLALSRALELSPSERDHLFVLAGVKPPESQDRPVDDETSELVHALLPHGAFVLDPMFDVVAHNAVAELIMADLLTAPRGHRNVLRWSFAGEPWSKETAVANLMDFRTEYARHPGDPAFVNLVEELAGASELFREWWSRHDVQVMEPSRKNIPHPDLGMLALLSIQTRPQHAPWLRLRILVPADDRTRRALGTSIGS